VTFEDKSEQNPSKQMTQMQIALSGISHEVKGATQLNFSRGPETETLTR